MVGSLALQSSQLAAQRASRFELKEFASFEIAEQLTLAQVLTDTPTPSLATLEGTHAAQLQALDRSQIGHTFDVQYVALQLQLHHELLDVQNSFLQVQPSMSSDIAHIAMLARTTIQMHLTLLDHLRQVVGEA
jgi:predicted outer membrane protein